METAKNHSSSSHHNTSNNLIQVISNPSIRMTVSAAPTVATLISQHQQKQHQQASAVTAACSICSRVSLTNLGKANANDPEQFMIFCATCESHSHPACLELNPKLVKWQSILDYKWQCMQCKTCTKCQKPYDEDKMMFCDRCDRGFHTYCVGLTEVPGGSFFCKACQVDPLISSTANSTVSVSTSNSSNINNNILNNSNNNMNNINNATPTVNRVCIDVANSNLLTKTPVTSRTNTPRSENKTGGATKRGRPLGSLNKPKDPNSSPKKHTA